MRAVSASSRCCPTLTCPTTAPSRCAVAFCHNLPPAGRLDLFERRRAELLTRAGNSRRTDGGDGRVNTYLRSLLERDTAALEADLAWLDRLIADERAAGATP